MVETANCNIDHDQHICTNATKQIDGSLCELPLDEDFRNMSSFCKLSLKLSCIRKKTVNGKHISNKRYIYDKLEVQGP